MYVTKHRSMHSCRNASILTLGLAVLFAGTQASAQDQPPPKGTSPVRVSPPTAEPLKPPVVHKSKEQLEQEAGPNAKVEFPQMEHDFGEIWIGGSMEHTFEVRNVGQKPLLITSVKPACGCTLAGAYDKNVAPGATGKIPIKLDSTKVTGNFSKTIRVTTNDPTQQNSTLVVKGKVNQYVEYPRTVNFGIIKPGEEKSKSILITNNSGKPLELTLPSAEVTKGFTAELVKKDDGDTYELRVHSKPPYQEGRNSQYVNVSTNVEKQSELKIRIAANVTPRLQIQPDSLIIAKAEPQATSRTVYITNNGNAPIVLLDASVDDPRLSVEREEIEPGGRYAVKVSIPPYYQPERAGKTVRLTFDDPEKKLVEIPVRRNARPPRPAELLVDKQAPAVKMTAYGKSEVIDTAKLQDEALVLKFYATWCGFCKKSLPNIEKVHQEYKDKGVRFVNVNLDDPNDPRSGRQYTQEQSLAKLKELGVTYDVVFDPDKTIGNLFKVQSYPTMFVLNKSGVVTNVNMGAISGNRIKDFKGQLDRILKAQDPKAAAQSPEGVLTSGTN